MNDEMLKNVNRSLRKEAVDIIIIDRMFIVDESKVKLIDIDSKYAIFPINIKTDQLPMINFSFYKDSEKVIGYDIAGFKLTESHYLALSHNGKVIENDSVHREK